MHPAETTRQFSFFSITLKDSRTLNPRHYVAIPPGPHLLSDLILNSPVLAGDRGLPEEAMGVPAPGAAPGGGNDFEFGVDPSLDPELAMVNNFFLLP